MRPLILDNAIRNRIQQVRAFAEDPANVNPVLEVIQGNRLPPGGNPNHVVKFQFGFRAVYSVDLDDTGNLWKHLSMSVNAPGRGPHPIAVSTVCEEFGIMDPHFARGQGLERNVVHAISLLVREDHP